MTAPAVKRTVWMQDGNVSAWCPTCGWRTRSATMGVLNVRVNRHVGTTGHRVQLERSQWKAAERA